MEVLNQKLTGQKKFRILEVCFSQSGGGLEMYMANISYYLMHRGHLIWTVAPVNSFIAEKIHQFGLPIITINPRLRYMDFLTARTLSKIVKKNQIDIIHVHQSMDLSTLILVKKFAGRGHIIFTQQMESQRKKQDIFHRWVYSNLDGLITITDRMRQQVLNNTLMPQQNVFRLYYGIPVEKFKPSEKKRKAARRNLGISTNDIVIGIVGRLEKGKGQHILLKAVSQLREYLDYMKVVIVGNETFGQKGYANFLKQQAEKSGLRDRVIFTGFQEDISLVASAFDICVLASRKETFGLSLIECMALEVAPIGTRAGGVPEIIHHEENGLLVPPFDASALALAIQKLIQNPTLRKKLALQARQTVLKNFNLNKHLIGLERIFSKITNNRASVLG